MAVSPYDADGIGADAAAEYARVHAIMHPVERRVAACRPRAMAVTVRVDGEQMCLSLTPSDPVNPRVDAIVMQGEPSRVHHRYPRPGPGGADAASRCACTWVMCMCPPARGLSSTRISRACDDVRVPISVP